MDHIWSPWRMNYIGRQKAPRGCIFCKAVGKKDGVENLIVMRGKLAFVILNRYPYTSGHVMVVPYAHATAINKVYKPEGFNIGANLGAVAGAGITNHIHFHVVPRWGGDTNFMTTVSSSRVLPENLCDTFQRLKDAWPKG
jgi:ATP adenylyltransferase